MDWLRIVRRRRKLGGDLGCALEGWLNRNGRKDDLRGLCLQVNENFLGLLVRKSWGFCVLHIENDRLGIDQLCRG